MLLTNLKATGATLLAASLMATAVAMSAQQAGVGAARSPGFDQDLAPPSLVDQAPPSRRIGILASPPASATRSSRSTS